MCYLHNLGRNYSRSLLFNLYRNYRVVFGVAMAGFAFAVVIGGLSAAYSFSSDSANATTTEPGNSSDG